MHVIDTMRRVTIYQLEYALATSSPIISPTSRPTFAPSDPSSSSESSGLSDGAIAGIVIAVLFAVVFLFAAGWYLYTQASDGKKEENEAGKRPVVKSAMHSASDDHL